MAQVPAWADHAQIQVNGEDVPLSMNQGFASVRQAWCAGDVVELHIPMELRLEEFPANGGLTHPDVVALLYGPLVFFPLREAGESGPLVASRAALLAAERTGPAEWTARFAGGPRRLVPFRDVGDRLYATYVQVPADAE